MKSSVIRSIAYMTLCLILSSPFAYAEWENETKLFTDYFNHLKNSDFQSIETNLKNKPVKGSEKGRFNNLRYKQSITELYRDATFQIVRVDVLDNNKKQVFIDIYYANDTRPVKTSFLIDKEKNRWVILEEIPFYD